MNLFPGSVLQYIMRDIYIYKNVIIKMAVPLNICRVKGSLHFSCSFGVTAIQVQNLIAIPEQESVPLLQSCWTANLQQSLTMV